MGNASDLRAELGGRSLHLAAARGLPHELTTGETPSVIFGRGGDQHGNFHARSFRNICARPDWARRLAKVHTGYRKALPRADWRWKELDAANSSDALLMNIFCYRRTLCGCALAAALGVPRHTVPAFGFRPGIPLANGKGDRTEIDMKLGDLLVEAKLTETGFQHAPARLVERYRDFAEVFDPELLPASHGVVHNYQLIRGVLAAHAAGGTFCLLCDARRPDLIAAWYSVVRSIASCTLRCRMRLITWQERAVSLPRSLQKFLAAKYGIGSTVAARSRP